MFDVTHIIQAGGIVLVALIIFSESGVMLGFFMPGDTLLMSAGILAASGKINLIGVLCAVAAAAIAGDNVGYHIGRSLGPRLFRKPDSVIFRKDHIEKAEAFYEKYGSKTMLVAHFIPVIRAFIPVTAGAAKMNYRLYVVFDAIGDIVWTTLLILFGYLVLSHIPGVEKYIEPIIIGVIVIFAIPALWHILRDPKMRAALLRRNGR